MILVNVILISYSKIQNVPVAQSPSKCISADFFRTFHQCDMLSKQNGFGAKHLQFPNKCHELNLRNQKSPVIFILYDVNAMEGFNLRRDVYIRMAVFIEKLRKQPNYENAYLVLPPFYRLYHWNLVSNRRHMEKEKDIVFWNHFFHLPSLKSFASVLDIWQYFEILRDCFGSDEQSKIELDFVFQLRHFDSMFETGKFEDRFEVHGECSWDVHRSQGQFNNLYSNFTSGRVHCVEFQGQASLLHDLLKQEIQV